jgi:Polyketide cyclase / dehydrase and lipid transport
MGRFKRMQPRRTGPLLTILLMWALFAAAFVYSPYKRQAGFAYPLVAHAMEIAAGADSVFAYLGDSRHAGQWSGFVDHITPLNADSVADGAPGSRRRCFCKRDETGRRWDETVLEAVPGKLRRFAIHDLVGFSAASDHLATDQMYETLPGGNCRLTFTFYFTVAHPSWQENFEMYLAAYAIRNIFARDMRNLKRILAGA